MYLDLEQTRMETGTTTGSRLEAILELDSMVEGKSTNLFCNLQKGKNWTSIKGFECFLSLLQNGHGSSGPWP